jgi:hypothetical protein
VFNGKPPARTFDDGDRLEITNVGPAYENGIARVRHKHFFRLTNFSFLSSSQLVLQVV